MGAYSEQIVSVDGIDTWVRRKPGEGVPILFWHGNPTDADDWLPFFERATAPCIAADMPGFGRSARPHPRDFAYTMDSYARWGASLVRELGLDVYDSVVHDWGSIGLLAAIDDPARLRRLVIFNCVPFGVGYRWHPVARIWRARGLGDLTSARAAPRLAEEIALRPARPGWQPMPADFTERYRRNLRRRETRDAVVRLYRSADPAKLDEAGEGLASISAPALLLWAADDPYIPARYGPRLARRFTSAELVQIENAGHWPWLDRPGLVDSALDFAETE